LKDSLRFSKDFSRILEELWRFFKILQDFEGFFKILEDSQLILIADLKNFSRFRRIPEEQRVSFIYLIE